MDMQPGEVGHFNTFLRERFSSEPEAASFIGGPSGLEAFLGFDEFARALRISGYRRAPERLFQQASIDGAVSVRELLRDSGLPRDPPAFGRDMMRDNPPEALDLTRDPTRDMMRDAGRSPPSFEQPHTLMPFEDVGAGRAEQQLRAQVEEMRHDISALQMRTMDAATREQLFEERGGRELGEGSMRQLIAKLEETLARETVALRADNADLRASLTEALRLLAEERRERQSDSSDVGRRVKDLQHWAEERTQRLEGLLRTVQQTAAENRTSLQEVEQLREMSEFRVLAAVAEESRARESSLQREQQSRESMCAELEARWRSLLGEERQLRNKENDTLAMQVSRCEDAVRNDKEVQSQRNNDVAVRLEDLTRELRDEARVRQSEFTQLSAANEETCTGLQNEARSRRDGEDSMSKRIGSVETAVEHFVDRSQQEFALVKQSILDLREASMIEATSREESCARLQNMIDDEARSREEAVSKEIIHRESAEARLEQHWRTLTYEERALREETENQLESKVVAVQHELNFEKAKTAAQGRELGQAISAAREALQGETSARRHEISLMTKGLEEVRDSLTEEAHLRDRAEARLLEQIGGLDACLREESVAREEMERRALGERSVNRDSIQRETASREDLESQLLHRIDQERRAREDADEKEATIREDSDLKHFTKTQSALNEEIQTRELGQRSLEHRAQADEQTIAVEKSEREERDRDVGARLAEYGEDLSEAKLKLRDCLTRCEQLNALREGLLAEKAQRETDEVELQLAVREQKLSFDQLQQHCELGERRVDRSLRDLADRLDQEAQDRTNGDSEGVKLMSEERQDRIASQQVERRNFEQAISNVEELLMKQTLEERGLREQGDKFLDGKVLELREAVDDARRWRIEQYNEIVLELSKVAEMLAEESKTRQQQDQVIAGEVGRLREETVEEMSARKLAVTGIREELQDILVRIEREREEWMGKEKERWRVIEVLRDELTVEVGRRDTGDDALRQLIDREVLSREETLAGATRAWQKANAKTAEEWRMVARTETAVREEAQLRLEQQIVEIRSGLLETRSVGDQRNEEVGQKFRSGAEALSIEESTRRAEEAVLARAIDDVRHLLAAEQAERSTGELMTADHFVVVESSLRDEAVLREDGDRRASKELVDLQSRIQLETAGREEADFHLERRIASEVAMREELQVRETRTREECDAEVLAVCQKSLREEQLAREDGRKDVMTRLSQQQIEMQTERDDRTKCDRDLSASMARLQSLQKEEEENRIEQGERLGAAVESLQDTVRVLGPQREEILKKCMEGVDCVRGMLNKEIVARTTKAEAIDEAVREVRLRLGDEVQQREAGVRANAEALIEERKQREEVAVRERRSSEEELQRAVQMTRKAREDEDRKVQEKLLTVVSTVNEERDLRQEALRQERQKLTDTQDAFKVAINNAEREVLKLSNQMTKQFDVDSRRVKDVDMTIANLTERCDTNRDDLANLTTKTITETRHLEQRCLEVQGLFQAEMQERRNMDTDLRKSLDSEAALRDAAVDGERRAREAGDLHGINEWKAAVRDERDAREAINAHSASEFTAVKAQIAEETGHREDERSQQHLVLQKAQADVSELKGERKVDVVAMREAFGQVSEELKVAQRARKEDVDRLDVALGAVSQRVDASTRSAREQSFALEQQLQATRSELQKEIDYRSGDVTKLDARLLEEHRFTEAAVAAEAKARETCLKLVEEGCKDKLSEETRKQQGTNDKLASQMLAVAEDVEKERAVGMEHTRELARSIAAVQGALITEETARKQNCTHLQQCIDLAREETASEAKERRSQAQSFSEDVALLQRGLQKRDDRAEALAKQLNADSNDLRERIIKESKLREAGVSQVEQLFVNAKNSKDGVPTAQLANNMQPSGPSGAEWKEYRRQHDEEIEKQRKLSVGLQTEQQALAKSVGFLDEAVDTVRAQLSLVQGSTTEVATRQKTLVEMEAQVVASREELCKEAAHRRQEDERLAAAQVEASERLERAEQQRVKGENAVRQEVLETKASLKKEVRDRELADSKVATLVREEAQQREEALEREGRLRQEGLERSSEALHQALREERKVREKEDLRLEGRSLAPVGASKGPDGVIGAMDSEKVGLVMEQRSLRQGLAEIQDRLTQTESRQKNAEERTVSMLDAIMSGLTGPGESD